MSTVLVLTGGPETPSRVALPPLAAVVAADGGAELAARLGLAVDVVVGDLDSLADRSALCGTRIERHPPAKDATDLELALETALTLNPENILVVGGSGGRLDHLLGELLLFASEAFARVQLDAQLGQSAVHVIRADRRAILGSAGELVSLFALHGPARGVTTRGLQYPLRGETLASGSTRGVSNVFTDAEMSISVEQGIVAAVRPNGSVRAGTLDR